jgi:two-component system, sensor histidine kinase and response regulator
MKKPKPFRVLIVEDSPLDARITIELFRVEGIDSDHVKTGVQALRYAAENNYDLIVLDLMLPDINGLELFLNLKKTEKMKDVPVIVISGITDKAKVVQALELGVNDYITKPFHGQELMTRAKHQIQFRKNAKDLADLNMERARFFAILAHDIKNPFNALLGFSELLVQGAGTFDETDKAQYGIFIHESAKSLHVLLENVLGWSAIQSGSLKPKPRSIEITALVDEIFPLYEHMARAKQITLIKDVSYHEVTTDQNMLSAVLRNLISNAIKFTPLGGKVSINGRMAEDFFEISVSDTGIGLAESEVANLFSLDPSRIRTGTSGEQGTGLGLALCRDFMEALGGNIQVKSMVGEGTSFTISLPMALDLVEINEKVH